MDNVGKQIGSLLGNLGSSIQQNPMVQNLSQNAYALGKNARMLGENAISNIQQLARTPQEMYGTAQMLQNQYGTPNQLLMKNPAQYAQVMTSPIAGAAQHYASYTPIPELQQGKPLSQYPGRVGRQMFQNPVTTALDAASIAAFAKMLAPNPVDLRAGNLLKSGLTGAPAQEFGGLQPGAQVDYLTLQKQGLAHPDIMRQIFENGSSYGQNPKAPVFTNAFINDLKNEGEFYPQNAVKSALAGPVDELAGVGSQTGAADLNAPVGGATVPYDQLEKLYEQKTALTTKSIWGKQGTPGAEAAQQQINAIDQQINAIEQSYGGNAGVTAESTTGSNPMSEYQTSDVARHAHYEIGNGGLVQLKQNMGRGEWVAAKDALLEKIATKYPGLADYLDSLTSRPNTFDNVYYANEDKIAEVLGAKPTTDVGVFGAMKQVAGKNPSFPAQEGAADLNAPVYDPNMAYNLPKTNVPHNTAQMNALKRMMSGAPTNAQKIKAFMAKINSENVPGQLKGQLPIPGTGAQEGAINLMQPAINTNPPMLQFTNEAASIPEILKAFGVTAGLAAAPVVGKKIGTSIGRKLSPAFEALIKQAGGGK